MKITEQDINAEVARTMREGLGLTQSAFWGPLGVQQSVGCRYEVDVKIPRAVRILMVARYVSGLEIDAQTPDGVEKMAKLGAMQAKFKTASSEAKNALRDLDRATKSIEQAKESLTKISKSN